MALLTTTMSISFNGISRTSNYNCKTITKKWQITRKKGEIYKTISRKMSNEKEMHIKGLPFNFDRKTANKMFAEREKSFFEEEHKTITENELILSTKDPITQSFLPFYSADILGVYTTFAGEFGIERVVSEIKFDNGKVKSTTKTVIDWYPCIGDSSPINYPFGTLSTQIYAGFYYPRSIIELSLQSPIAKNIRELNKDQLIDPLTQKTRTIYPHEMKESFALEKIHSRIFDLEKNRIQTKIMSENNATHSRITSMYVHFDQAKIKLFSYHIPAFIYQLSPDNISTLKIMHGFTGQIKGKLILSTLKTALFGGGIVGIGSMIAVTAILGPAGTLANIAARSAIAAATSGILSAFGVKIFNYFSHKSDRKQIEKDFNENKFYMESDDDFQRKKTAKEFNFNEEFFKSSKGILLPKDKCKLLNLNLNSIDEINLEVLKSAYYSQLKNWHPDTYPGDKSIAENMTVQINLAYHDISALLKAQQNPSSSSSSSSNN